MATGSSLGCADRVHAPQCHQDAPQHRLLKACDVVENVPVVTARRAAYLRTQSHQGSAVDALVVAVAEPGGTVLTGDTDDLSALASYATDVLVDMI